MAIAVDETSKHAPAAREAQGTGSDEALIGEGGKTVRCIAFGGGAVGTSAQLGVIQALLVSRSAAPDLVVGVSAGAVNAVALAEVLQAPSTNGSRSKGEAPTHSENDPACETSDSSGFDEQADQVARVARFREILEGYLSAPRHLASKLIPDSYQIDASTPLEPLDLPSTPTPSTQRGHARSERVPASFISATNFSACG